MKNTFIGLILGFIVAMWAFYIYTQKPVVKNTPSPVPTATTISTVPSVATVSDETLIKQAFAKKYNKSISDVQLTIKNNTGTLANGGVSFLGEEGGAWWLASKENASWKIVQDGNGTVTCEIVAPYKFPVSMLPECVDKNGKLVKF